MTDRAVAIIGLPESGKTTFLAALWHVLTEQDINSTLKLHSLGRGNSTHLNTIAARWREAKIQDRTATTGNRIVEINLTNTAGTALRVTFPDTAGEAYQAMWENRECDPIVANSLAHGNILLFVHGDTIQAPMWVVDEAALLRRMGLPVASQEPVAWHPRLAPTQVQLVEILQFLRMTPIDVGKRRVAIILSAWDKVEPEGLTPWQFLETRLPLLAQYLQHSLSKWNCRVYGLSAQGGEYDSIDSSAHPSAEAENLRRLERPSERIRLVSEATVTHDLTEPLEWLLADDG